MSRAASRRVLLVCVSAGFAVGITVSAMQTSSSPALAAQSGRATGEFDVKLTPHPFADAPAGLGAFTIDKQFRGDLEGASRGQMLTATTDVKESAGYVAVERVTGTLRGRTGAFTLQHNATMTRGTPQLNIIVVPDSGTGQLVGLTGKMTIDIVAGKHFYAFEYSVP
jgi:Protein of unknown function (DUF3224)